MWAIGAAGTSPAFFVLEIKSSSQITWIIGERNAMKFDSREAAQRWADVLSHIAGVGLFVHPA